ncbi:MAG: hypothetical protein RMJ88_15590 [Thermogemmata sp.]|nr:hypothetical protein [Thermogemmata sp.]
MAMIARYVLSYKTPYPTAQERLEIENYLATVKARRAALEEVRRVVAPAIESLINRMRVAYPHFAKFHPYGFEKGQRDMVLLTNMAANAMFLGEYQTLDEMITEWYRTILKAVHISPQFLRDTFSHWQEELKLRLSDEAWGLMRPVVEHLTEYLTQVPVPAKDEVGERRPFPPAAPPNVGAKTWKS